MPPQAVSLSFKLVVFNTTLSTVPNHGNRIVLVDRDSGHSVHQSVGTYSSTIRWHAPLILSCVMAIEPRPSPAILTHLATVLPTAPLNRWH